MLKTTKSLNMLISRKNKNNSKIIKFDSSDSGNKKVS